MRSARFGVIAATLVASLSLVGCGGSDSDDPVPVAGGGTETGGIEGGGVNLESPFEQNDPLDGLQAADIRKVFSGLDLCMVPGQARGAVLSTGGGNDSAIVYFSLSSVPPSTFDYPAAYLIEDITVVPDGENNEGWLRGQYSAGFKTEKGGLTDTIPLSGYVIFDPNNDRMYISCEDSDVVNGDKFHTLFDSSDDTWPVMVADISDAHVTALKNFKLNVADLRLDREANNITADQYITDYAAEIDTYRVAIDAGFRAAFNDNEPAVPGDEENNILSYYDAAQQLVYWIGQSDDGSALRSDYMSAQRDLASGAAVTDLNQAFTDLESAYSSLVTDFATPPPAP